MGIRMLHRRTAPPRANADALTRVPLPPVPASAATASTARLPATFASALRHTAEDLRRRLTPRDPVLRAMALGDAARPEDPPLWRQWTNLALGRIDLALRGPESRPGDPAPWRQWADLARTLLRSASRPGETLPWRQWADLVRGYLALALAALPRPRPVQTVTVFVAAPESVTGRPYGPAPHRRRRDGRGPEPDATA
ncbi:hypothetical protein [Streptomyces sp. DH24]|uniref:hypothetical protein n=1 Tax=Streptomyces sp. DH24 TaxID=3040123 RepID=UPI002440F800|nr:hypothetical protein [Streptomyces sp. DH24]MDG9715256.1 hypothetical protein [Streptomyces sp. DH24]